MKRVLKYTILVCALVVAVLFISMVSGMTNEQRHATACSEMDIIIRDSAQSSFIVKDDIRRFISEDYGTWLGQRIDSVDLRRLEDSLRRRSAIKDVEAYITRDGRLHVEVSQREPVIYLKDGGKGFFADADGCIIPVGKGTIKGLRQIEGVFPLSEPASHQGIPDTEEERQWLKGLLGFVDYLEADRFWSGYIKRVVSDSEGFLTLYPKEGKERFLFGYPEEYPRKFSRMEKYYEYILPAREKDYYKVVDVRWEGQIVCREK